MRLGRKFRLLPFATRLKFYGEFQSEGECCRIFLGKEYPEEKEAIIIEAIIEYFYTDLVSSSALRSCGYEILEHAIFLQSQSLIDDYCENEVSEYHITKENYLRYMLIAETNDYCNYMTLH